MRQNAYVVMVNVPEEDWSHKIDERRKVVGRAADAEIRTPAQHARVSRRHAVVWRDADRIWLQDEGSRYGTIVNGVFIRSGQPIKITVGDRLALANLELHVVGQLSKLAELMAETQACRFNAAGSSGGGKTASVRLRPHELARAALEHLTPSELDVMLWMNRGYTQDSELGKVLYRSPHTIRTQIASIFSKLNVHSRSEIVTWLKLLSGTSRSDARHSAGNPAAKQRTRLPKRKVRHG